MRVAVAGSTGVLGHEVLPALTAAGHECLGLARSPAPSDEWESAEVDVLDAAATRAALARWRPDAVVHLATAIPQRTNPRRMRREFAPTNRLRTEGTRNLIEAGREAGAGRLIVQSIAFAYAPGGDLAREDAPLLKDPPAQFAPALDALEELERLTQEAGGIVLRFGHLYGPGSAFARDGSMGAAAARGFLPVLRRRGGEASFSFIHARDAAGAVASALVGAGDEGGTFNVVDDEPAAPAEWIPALAESVGGPRPRRVPALLLRPLLGAYGVDFMTRIRGASNERAKERLGWSPSISSWREGFPIEARQGEWAMLGSNQRP